jgi:hypothetical protein
MRKMMKFKGKIYKYVLPTLRLSVPEDFNLKWFSPWQNPDRARANVFCLGTSGNHEVTM